MAAAGCMEYKSEALILKGISASVRPFEKPSVEVIGNFMDCFVMMLTVLHGFRI